MWKKGEFLKMKVKKISEIINEEVEKDTKLQYAILKINLKNIFEELFSEISLDYIKENKLYIRVKNSAIKHYMYTNKNKYLEKINNFNENIKIIIDDIYINVK